MIYSVGPCERTKLDNARCLHRFIEKIFFCNFFSVTLEGMNSSFPVTNLII